ncbi:hypothetical protein GA0115254_116079 [Streptomyces sp. Ncost-T10-10d]|nr:hypothetical protein GA0115254_116079 [Streptomyces sp. Ncost-T10-10d]
MRWADAGVMSHHLSGPDLRSPVDDARLDLTDLFAFCVPGDRTVPMDILGGTFKFKAWRGSNREHR